MTAANPTLPFRPDIEGLRAVAILLVIAAHAGVPGLAGGFVGVDVFFVLSGYLITRMLAHPSRPSLLHFYAARLRRLLPALLLVFSTTVLLAIVLLAPMEQRLQVDLAQAVPLWLGNLSLAAREVSYFGAAADSLLFQHTWSLALEEQFYLVWPMVLLLALGVARGREGTARRALWLLGAVLLASLAWSVVGTARAPVASYYLLPARFWQFALGGCVALAFDPAFAGAGPRPHARLAGAVGAGLLASSALWLEGGDSYPGWLALLPSAGTAALLYGGMLPSAPLTRALSAPAMQWLGRLSYGWYLWHWPVLLLGRTLLPEPAWPQGIALSLLALALAAVSFRWVEAPLRHSPTLKRRPGLVLVLAGTAMAVGWMSAQSWGDAAGRWQELPSQRRFLLASVDQSRVYREGCDDFSRPLRATPCSYGPATAPRTVAMIGDSVGLQWFPAIERVFPAPEWRIVVMTRSACPMADSQVQGDAMSCAGWRDAAVASIAVLEPDRVIVGSSANYRFSPGDMERSTQRFLARLAPHAGEVVLLEPTPIPGFDGPACLARGAWRSPALASTVQCARSWQPGVEPRAERARAAGAIANARLVDANDLVCPGNECTAGRGALVVYRDRLHLTASFVASLAQPLGERLSATTR